MPLHLLLCILTFKYTPFYLFIMDKHSGFFYSLTLQTVQPRTSLSKSACVSVFLEWTPRSRTAGPTCSFPHSHSPGTASSGITASRALESCSLWSAWPGPAQQPGQRPVGRVSLPPAPSQIRTLRLRDTTQLAWHSNLCMAAGPTPRWPPALVLVAMLTPEAGLWGPEPAVLGWVPSCCPGSSLQQKQQICSKTLEHHLQPPSAGATGTSRART